MFYAFTMDDVGYNGYSTPEHLLRVLEMTEKSQIKATFFVVPKCDLTEYRQLLLDAVAAGHEIAQHGLEHHRFEVGVPPEMVLKAPHEKEFAEYLKTHRAEIESGLSLEKICARMNEGRKLLEDIFQIPVRGFRAPCLQFCDNMFKALAVEGYVYDSSCWLQTYNWKGSGLSEPVKITREDFLRRQHAGFKEFPLTADYVWELTWDRYDAKMKLAMFDFENIRAAGFPLVNLSHVSPIQRPDDSGLRFIAEWVGRMRERCPGLVSATLSEISQKFKI